ncbi:MAG: hypothetical protein OEZ03_17610, partial [Alphaproteobacteria bacterium]|nr:hypothetical protein [Alphaproteobacteria bacterium]
VSASWGDLLANWRRTLLLGLPLGAVCAATVATWVTLAGDRRETFVEEAFENPDFPSLSTFFLPTATASELLLGLLGILPVIFAVAAVLPAVHRTARKSATASMPFRFGRPESLYGLTLLALFLFFGSLEMLLLPAAWDSIFVAGVKLFPETVEPPGLGLTLFFGLLAILLTGLAAALLAWLPARILLALPALATGADRPFVQGWRLGRGNGWRLLWIVFVAILPAVWLLSPINLLLNGWVTDPAQIDRDAPTALMAPGDLWVTSAIILTGMLYAVVFLLAGTAISAAWRALTEIQPEAKTGVPLKPVPQNRDQRHVRRGHGIVG